MVCLAQNLFIFVSGLFFLRYGLWNLAGQKKTSEKRKQCQDVTGKWSQRVTPRK
jgi:hypothetical protein